MFSTDQPITALIPLEVLMEKLVIKAYSPILFSNARMRIVNGEINLYQNNHLSDDANEPL